MKFEKFKGAPLEIIEIGYREALAMFDALDSLEEKRAYALRLLSFLIFQDQLVNEKLKEALQCIK